MLSPNAFKNIDTDSLYLLIKDAQKRIDSNPLDKNYVQQQKQFIRNAQQALKDNCRYCSGTGMHQVDKITSLDGEVIGYGYSDCPYCETDK